MRSRPRTAVKAVGCLFGLFGQEREIVLQGCYRRHRWDTFGLPPIAPSRSLSAMPRVVIDPAVPDSLDNEIARLRGLDVGELRARWHTVFRRRAPPHLPRHLLFRILAYRLQANRLGELDNDSRRLLDRIGSG